LLARYTMQAVILWFLTEDLLSLFTNSTA